MQLYAVGKMMIQYYTRIYIDEFDYCFLSLPIVLNDLFLYLFLHFADESFSAEASSSSTCAKFSLDPNAQHSNLCLTACNKNRRKKGYEFAE